MTVNKGGVLSGDELVRIFNQKNTNQSAFTSSNNLSEHTLSSTYESVNKNLRSYPYTLTYSMGNVSTVTYDLGGGLSVVKTYSYSAGKLTTVVLSGDLPVIFSTLTKNFFYTGANLTSVTYT
jgi:hypothetical protein